MLEACMTYDPTLYEPEDFPYTDDPVWLLGRKYNSIKDRAALHEDVQSRLWFTYRRGFSPIGGSGPTSDKGWGCMLRCGQMVMAEALVRKHLGRSWTWSPETSDPTYLKIVTQFEERPSAIYSLKQIALMGVSEGKEVGQWFGPNTVCQVLRKLVTYDHWTCPVVHVALDGAIVIKDIKSACSTRQTSAPERTCGLLNGEGSPATTQEALWQPLLLVIPLRLGLTEINPVYTSSIKTCFTLPHTLGIIGGKPNHALYFIGYVGDQLVYLDPHTTQQSACVGSKQLEGEREADLTYHCNRPCFMEVNQLDPSIALCFFCDTEKDFDSLCQHLQKLLIEREKCPMFEVCEVRPQQWTTCDDPGPAEGACCLGFEQLDRHFDDSDDDFELLG